MELVFPEEVISLVEDNGLNSGQFKVGFGEQLHEPAGGGDDDVGVDGKAFELPLVGVPSQN